MGTSSLGGVGRTNFHHDNPEGDTNFRQYGKSDGGTTFTPTKPNGTSDDRTVNSQNLADHPDRYYTGPDADKDVENLKHIVQWVKTHQNWQPIDEDNDGLPDDPETMQVIKNIAKGTSVPWIHK